MSLADDVRDLNAEGAAMRQEARGVDQAGNPQLGRMEDAQPGDTFSCYFSSGKTAEAMQPLLMFKDVYDIVVRVAKTEKNFVARQNKTIRLIGAGENGSDIVARIEEIQTSALNPEYVCGCKAP